MAPESEPVAAETSPRPRAVTASDAPDPEHSFGGVGESRTGFRPSDSTIATRLAPPRFDHAAELAADDRFAAVLMAASPTRRGRAPMATRWRRDLPILERQVTLLESAVVNWCDAVEDLLPPFYPLIPGAVDAARGAALGLLEAQGLKVDPERIGALLDGVAAAFGFPTLPGRPAWPSGSRP